MASAPTKRPGLWLPPSGSAVAAVGGNAHAPAVTTISARASAAASRPRSEAMSLMAEMKFKQEKRDQRARLKRELEELTASGVNDLLRVATLRGQLASVESFLASTDGMQSLAPQAAAPPCNPADDLDSTNLYVGSLAPEWTEEMLMREFGRFGDVASIKIMYPRTELQRMRGMNCGFVQFRTRKQAEAAKARLNGKEFYGMCLRIDWGKSVQPSTGWGARPSVQPQLQPHVEGPPSQGAPASLDQKPAERKSRWNKAKTIAVSIPEDKVMKRLIDKTAEFVVVEGWEFEKQLLERECENPRFAFLRWDTPERLEDPLHVYYRWRAFSYAQGDSEEQWRTEPFQVYDNGPLWQSPSCDRRERVTEEQGGPTLMIPHFDVIRQPGLAGARRRGGGGVGSLDLTTEEQRKLDELIAGLTLSRSSVLAAMAFCLDASGASQQVAQRLCGAVAEAAEAREGLAPAQLSARLFLLSDVLYNSHCTRPGASMYRRQFQEFLPDVFEQLGQVCDSISHVAAGALRDRVSRLLRAWSEWSTFPPQFVKGLEATLCCRGSQRPGLADSEGGGAEGSKPKALQMRLQQWRATTDAASLERACRLRGLATKGGQQDLVERLCAFEAYWQEELAAAAATAAAAAAEQRRRLEEEVCDPELDGEALDEEELKAIAAAGMEEEELEAQEAKEALRNPGLLLGGMDLGGLAPSGDTAIEVSVAAEAAAKAEAAGEAGAATERRPVKVAEERQQRRSSQQKTSPKLAANPGQRRVAAACEATAERREEDGGPSGQAAGSRPPASAAPAAPPAGAVPGCAGSRGRERGRKVDKEKGKEVEKPKKVEKEKEKEKEKKEKEKEKEPEKPKKANKEPDKPETVEKPERPDKSDKQERQNKDWKKRSRSHSQAAAPKKRHSRSRSAAAARRRRDDDRGSSKAARESSCGRERPGDRSRSRSRDRKLRRSRSRSRGRRKR